MTRTGSPDVSSASITVARGMSIVGDADRRDLEAQLAERCQRSRRPTGARSGRRTRRAPPRPPRARGRGRRAHRTTSPVPRYIAESATSTTTSMLARRSGRIRYGDSARRSAAATAAVAAGNDGPLPVRTVMPSELAERVPSSSLQSDRDQPRAGTGERGVTCGREPPGDQEHGHDRDHEPDRSERGEELREPLEGVGEAVDDLEEVGVDVVAALGPEPGEQHAEHADDQASDVAGTAFRDADVGGSRRAAVGRVGRRSASRSRWSCPSPG